MTRRRSDAGSAIAEMAIIAPLVMLILIGLMEMGRYARMSVIVANAARSGVQYGAQNLGTADDSTGISSAASNDAQGISGLTVTPTRFCTCADGSASTCAATDCSASHRMVFVQVDVSGTFSSMLHMPGVPNTQTVTSRAVMRVPE